MGRSPWIVAWFLVQMLAGPSETHEAKPPMDAAGNAAERDLTLEPYLFVSAKGDSLVAEWGVLRVPENRADPASHRIELAFVRFKSTAAHPGPAR